jgi:signal transduction histidine kinase/CheY-like chemotaxis protein
MGGQKTEKLAKLAAFSEFRKEYGRAAPFRKRFLAVRHPFLFCTMRVMGEELDEFARQNEDRFSQLQKSSTLGRVALDATHDGTGLLTAILGFLRIARHDLGSVTSSAFSGDIAIKNVGDSMDQAISCAEKLKEVLTSAMDVARHGEKSHPMDVNPIVTNYVELFERDPVNAINAKYSICASPAAESEILASEIEIYRLVQNLVNNAKGAMPDGGVIIVSTKDERLAEGIKEAFGNIPAGSYVKLSVMDSGTGISDENLPKLFRPFFTTKAEGTGIGLSVVKKIAENHGAHIAVKTQPGCGTSFEVYLPALERRADSHAAQRKKKILVVDDEVSIRSFLGRHLARKGFEVLLASNWGEAQAFCEKQTDISFVFTDFILRHDTDSYEILEVIDKIRKANHALKLFVMSGHPSAGKLQELVGGKEVDGFLMKPFNPSDLDALIGDGCGKAQPPASEPSMNVSAA